MAASCLVQIIRRHLRPAVARRPASSTTRCPWGNESSMNLNALILANIQSSSYFKGATKSTRVLLSIVTLTNPPFFCVPQTVHLFKLKTYHEVVDEIYYQVKHMEPWERGSRKTSGQTGMCGGVSGLWNVALIVGDALCNAWMYVLIFVILFLSRCEALAPAALCPRHIACSTSYTRCGWPGSRSTDCSIIQTRPTSGH